jgi:uncharacterized protein
MKKSLKHSPRKSTFSGRSLVSERLPTRGQALRYLQRSGCRENVIRHAEAVSALAVEIAEVCRDRGHNVDVELVEVGGLLHDIGRARTHTVHHAVIGAEIARSLNIPKPIISIIKRHVGGGITAREARKLGWPKDIYTPQTLEEKIVAYADKLVAGSHRVPVERTIEALSRELPPSAIERIWELHQEMLALVGDCECLP